ncbi:hypothetical protein [uncultured Tenacibaculum sp.]|uniref:hypothetical protein n=1 Tax=uncultured Tenacibaculum sp. TaxID=174713 RepID=UPI00262EAF03|nr:hypothetical protein [uncultured Tenacibaculum sp.]
MLLLFCFSCKKTVEKQEVKKENFTYKPQKPENGILKGVVELGTSGFNYFIVEIDSLKNWELKKASYNKSLIAEAMTNADEIDHKLNSFLSKIKDLGVTEENINFVVSSGAMKEEVTQLIIEELRKRNHVVQEITPKQEAVYGLKAILPEELKGQAFVADIGSGNTKFSFIENNKVVGKETHGSKYHQKGTEDEDVYSDVKKVVASVPEKNRKYCFILGGVPFELAKALRKENERYTVLSLNKKQLTQLAEEKGKKVLSGLNIFNAIADESNCQNFIFDWSTNFSIGYLLAQESKN